MLKIFSVQLKNIQKMSVFLIFIPIMMVLGTKGAIMSSDSSDYISHSIIRSPLYPLLIDSIDFLFKDWNYFPLALMQLSLGFYAAISMVRTLQDLFKFNQVIYFVLLLLYLSPYSFLFGNLILSEGLAYPLFLFAMQAFFKGLLRKNFNQMYLFVFYTSMLILTRRQYLFLYVVGFISFAYMMFLWDKDEKDNKSPKDKKDGIRKTFFVLMLLLSITGTHVLESTYHYVFNNRFTTVPFVGFQLIIMPLYLSSPEDEKLFTDEKEASVFREAHRNMRLKQCSAGELWSKDTHPDFHHYYMNYNNVCWGSLSPALSKNRILDWNEKDSMLIHMSWILIKSDPIRYISLYLRNVIHGLGGYYFFGMILFVFLSSFYFHIKNRDKLSSALFFSILLSYGNYFSTALVEPAMTRYTFSTNIVMVSIFVICFFLFFKNNSYKCGEP